MISLSTHPTVTAIIPEHNSGHNLRRCLSSLASAVPPPEEIIVVADGDTEGSWRLAEEFASRILRIPVARGPASARNLGANSAKGDILFFVDADVVILRDVIQRILAVFQKDPDLAALFGSYDDEPFEANFLSQYKNLFHHYVHQTGREEAFTFWTACGAIRRDVFLELDGFDHRYTRPSIEDIDLGYRLKRAGYRVKLIKSLQVKHLKYWGPVSLLRSDFLDRALPWAKLILKDRSLNNDLNLRYSNRLSVVLAYLLLSSLMGAVWQPVLILVAGLVALLLLILNAPLYGFFRHKRGLWFTLRAIPWHWFYYLYGGLAFAMAVVQCFWTRAKSDGSFPGEDPENPSGKIQGGLS